LDKSALFRLGYGLYVLTAHHDGRDNGCIINTVMQITDKDPFIAIIAVNKHALTHDMIMESRKFNISVFIMNTPFEIIQHFGFQSGRDVDKFPNDENVARSKNGILYFKKSTNAFLSMNVIDTIDFDTHTMFKSEIVDGGVMGSGRSLNYARYHEHIRPKPAIDGFFCRICGYVLEGDLPSDFICPKCKCGAKVFSKVR